MRAVIRAVKNNEFFIGSRYRHCSNTFFCRSRNVVLCLENKYTDSCQRKQPPTTNQPGFAAWSTQALSSLVGGFAHPQIRCAFRWDENTHSRPNGCMFNNGFHHSRCEHLKCTALLAIERRCPDILCIIPSPSLYLLRASFAHAAARHWRSRDVGAVTPPELAMPSFTAHDGPGSGWAVTFDTSEAREILAAALSARPADWHVVVVLVQRHGRVLTHLSLEPNSYTALHYAAMHDKPEYAALLCARGADPRAADADGFQPLHHCGLGRDRGFVRVADALLRAGADVDAVDADGETLLHIACCFGHIALVRMLVEHGGADVNRKNTITGQTPLHWSSVFGYTAVAQLLIQAGADLQAETNTGETVRFMAAWRGHHDFVTWLDSVGEEPEP
jgi:ankyrin repeat protein